MLTLLSPAKSMNEERTTSLRKTKPRLLDATQDLLSITEKLSVADLQTLMHISDDLARLNAGRFTDFNTQKAHPAALLFDGDVYWGLDAKSLDEDGLRAANDRVRILSGLYGILRPLDAIRPYRLEMGTKLMNSQGNTLYKFWGDSISEVLRKDTKGHEDPTILNLASNEYFKAVDKKALDRPIVNVKFLNVKDGKAKNLAFFAKRARGQLARFIVDNRIDHVEGSKDFNYGGYSFDAKASTETDYVFTRKQPPPPGKKAGKA